MKKTSNLMLKHARKFECFSSLSEEDKKMLASVGISTSALPDCVYSIDCSGLNRIRHGVGLRNVNGGVEFINFYDMDDAVTIRAPGISIVPAANRTISENCCVFYSVVDYMAYATLLQRGTEWLPQNCDSIILGSCKNIIALVVESEDYFKIYTFFPNTEIGGILRMTFAHRNPDNVVNCEHMYEQYKSLMAYNRHLSTNKNDKQE